jgi:hypothetical protein
MNEKALPGSFAFVTWLARRIRVLGVKNDRIRTKPWAPWTRILASLLISPFGSGVIADRSGNFRGDFSCLIRCGALSFWH